MFLIFDEVTGFTDGFRLALHQLPATLGRADDATIQLTNVLVSRYHSSIDVQDGKVVLRDLNSLNGTFVNEESVDSAILEESDSVQVGLQQFCVTKIDYTQLCLSHAATGRRN